MTLEEARELAGYIVKSANRQVRVKANTTNGAGVVHVAVTEHPKHSVTLKSKGEWLASDLNRLNHTIEPRKKKARNDEADEATVAEALTTVYSPED